VRAFDEMTLKLAVIGAGGTRREIRRLVRQKSAEAHASLPRDSAAG